MVPGSSNRSNSARRSKARSKGTETSAVGAAPSLPAKPQDFEKVDRHAETLSVRKGNPQSASSWEEALAVDGKVDQQQLIAGILAGRDVSPRDITVSSFRVPNLNEELSDLGRMKCLDQACERITAAIRAGTKIAICCDYDVDGTTGGSALKLFLDSLGTKTEIFVSDRLGSGYGLKPEKVDQAKAKGCDLIIVVDQGTNDLAALTQAKELEIETIVVDHHQLGEEDIEHDCLVNPARPDCGYADGRICGSGLSWCLIKRMTEIIPEAAGKDPMIYLPFAALGTVADRMQLVKENRAIVTEGLRLLPDTKIQGLRQFLKSLKLKGEVKTKDVNFSIAPLINAASRMAHAQKIAELFTTSKAEDAEEIIAELIELNTERQRLVKKLSEECFQEMSSLVELPPGIVAGGDGFHHGVIGIVAQQLVNRYQRPVAILGEERGGRQIVSIRAPTGFDVNQAIKKIGPDLITGGGHVGAGGGSISSAKAADFEAAFQAECLRQKRDEERGITVVTDLEVALEDLNFDFVEALRVLEPCGPGNEDPVFAFRDLLVKQAKVFKDRHLRVVLSNGELEVFGWIWNRTEHPALKAGEKVNIAATVQDDKYMGQRTIKLHLQGAETAEVAEEDKQREEEKDFLGPAWDIKIVAGDGQLAEMVSKLESAKLLAVDTETVFEHGDEHDLCLVQIGDPESETNYLVDVLAVSDLSPLKKILESPEILKIEHNAGFEEQRFREVGIEQVNVVDTLKLAKTLLPHYPNHQLKTLVHYLLGETLSKAEQEGDWSRRPLSEDQIFYAALDPEITYKLYQALMAVAEGVDLDVDKGFSSLMGHCYHVERRIDQALFRDLREYYSLLEEKENLRVTIKKRLNEGSPTYNGPCGYASVGSPTKSLSVKRLRPAFARLTAGILDPDAAEELLEENLRLGVRAAQAAVESACEKGLELDAEVRAAIVAASIPGETKSPVLEIDFQPSKEKPKGKVIEDSSLSIAELMEKYQAVELKLFEVVNNHPRLPGLYARHGMLKELIEEQIIAGESYKGKFGKARLSVRKNYPRLKIIKDKLREAADQQDCLPAVDQVIAGLKPFISRNDLLSILLAQGFAVNSRETREFLSKIMVPSGKAGHSISAKFC